MFDDTIFKMLHEKQAGWLAQDRTSVIEKLNMDFQQALVRMEEGWFGR